MNVDLDTLYVVDKIWQYKPGLKLDVNDVNEIAIRPCDASYKTYRRFSLGLPTRCKTIAHGSAVMLWMPKINFCSHALPHFKTYEEFVVYANVNKCIVPLFENWSISGGYHQLYCKTIDLKTHEVLYDNINNVMKRFNEQHDMHLV